MTYIIIEIQKQATGAALVPPLAFDSRDQAEQKYHNTLAAAAVSSVPAHTVVMLDDTGNVIQEQTYYHKS